jgi:hypothetical protein
MVRDLIPDLTAWGNFLLLLGEAHGTMDDFARSHRAGYAFLAIGDYLLPESKFFLVGNQIRAWQPKLVKLGAEALSASKLVGGPPIASMRSGAADAPGGAASSVSATA